MNFLNSAFLAGLVAALIPLLIHLLNRRRLKTVDFSSVMFLRDLRKTRMRRLQLRRWLLLLIRTLLIATMVIAFARPALRGGIFATLGSRARTTAVLAIDRSASMALETQNGTAYERALARLSEVTDVWGDGDAAIALPFTYPVPATADPPTADLSTLLDHLREIPVGNGATDAGAAINTALEAVGASPNLNREIYLFSDFRREGMIRTAITPPSQVPGEDVTIYLVDVAEPGGYDLGVGTVTLANRLIEPGSPFAVSASVVNHTDRPVDRLLVSLFVDGRRVGQREADVAANGTVTVDFSTVVESAGVHYGFIEISADDNAANNRHYFSFAIPEEIRVLLASDYASGRIPTALALSPQGGTGTRVTVTESDCDDIIRENLFDYDCVVITEWRAPQREVTEHLLRYVRAGGGVFIAPSFDADTTAWNTLIAGPHYGMRLGPPLQSPSPDRYFVWERYDWNHPIWSVYAGVPRDRIPEVRWHAIFRTEGQSGGRAIVDFSGGRPSLSETQLGTGKLLALWTPMAPAYTNLPLRSIFVPFAHRLVEYLAADISERRSDFLVGEPVVREPARILPPEAALEVIAPDGTRLRPGVERDGGRARITFDGLSDPGVYTIVADLPEETVIDAFAVNVDPAETDPAVISTDELRRRWDGYHLVFAEAGRPLETIVSETRYGTEIRSTFLWIVAAFFLFEMLVARTRRRDLPTTTGSAAPVTAD